MAIYHKPVWELMKDMVSDIELTRGEVISKKEVLDWFSNNFPLIKSGTIEAHLIKMSTNAPSRLHYNVVPRQDDLLYKIDSQNFRLYQPDTDRHPIWSEMDISKDEVRQTRQRAKKNYQTRVVDISENLKKYHTSFYEMDVFTGPSLYFHRKALAMLPNDDYELFLERIYATLVAWGMHRMGKNGAKMTTFKIFSDSVNALQDEIAVAQNIDCQNIQVSDWFVLNRIFTRIRIMETCTSLVGNSKVMAHLLPHLIPPIDRAYTLTYLQGHINIQNELNYEWSLFKNIISNFFIPISKDNEFVRLSGNWINKQDKYPWDTSPLKIIDNLVIAAVNLEKKSA